MLKQTLRRIHPIDDKTLDDYVGLWHPVDFKRKSIINPAGTQEKYLYFVLQGIQKAAFTSEGKEYILAFSYPGTFSGDPASLFRQKPSQVTLSCITDSKLLRISYATHQQQLSENPILETLFRRATEMLLAGVLDRYQELMALSIEERFRSFALRSGQLLNMIPQKDLAAYLRIDPTNFSKLINSIRI